MIISIKKRLKELRENSNLSQNQISKILNISRSSIAAYESTTTDAIPSLDVLVRYADYFNTTLDYLVARSESKYDVSRLTNIELELMQDIQSIIFKYREKDLNLTLSPKQKKLNI